MAADDMVITLRHQQAEREQRSTISIDDSQARSSGFTEMTSATKGRSFSGAAGLYKRGASSRPSIPAGFLAAAGAPEFAFLLS